MQDEWRQQLENAGINADAFADYVTTQEHAESLLRLRTWLRKWLLRRRFKLLVFMFRDSKYAQSLRRRNRCVQEILTTERTYVSGLQKLVEQYLAPMQRSLALDRENRSEDLAAVAAAYGAVSTLLGVHLPFIRELENAMTDWPLRVRVGHVLLDLAPQLVGSYAAFVTLYDSSVERFRTLSRTAPLLRACLPGASEWCRHLEQLFILPVQRVPRYVLLLRELLKYISNDNADMADLSQAQGEMQKAADRINQHKRMAESRLAWRHFCETLRRERNDSELHNLLMQPCIACGWVTVRRLPNVIKGETSPTRRKRRFLVLRSDTLAFHGAALDVGACETWPLDRVRLIDLPEASAPHSAAHTTRQFEVQTTTKPTGICSDSWNSDQDDAFVFRMSFADDASSLNESESHLGAQAGAHIYEIGVDRERDVSLWLRALDALVERRRRRQAAVLRRLRSLAGGTIDEDAAEGNSISTNLTRQHTRSIEGDAAATQANALRDEQRALLCDASGPPRDCYAIVRRVLRGRPETRRYKNIGVLVSNDAIAFTTIRGATKSDVGQGKKLRAAAHTTRRTLRATRRFFTRKVLDALKSLDEDNEEVVNAAVKDKQLLDYCHFGTVLDASLLPLSELDDECRQHVLKAISLDADDEAAQDTLVLRIVTNRCTTLVAHSNSQQLCLINGYFEDARRQYRSVLRFCTDSDSDNGQYKDKNNTDSNSASDNDNKNFNEDALTQRDRLRRLLRHAKRDAEQLQTAIMKHNADLVALNDKLLSHRYGQNANEHQGKMTVKVMKKLGIKEEDLMVSKEELHRRIEAKHAELRPLYAQFQRLNADTVQLEMQLVQASAAADLELMSVTHY